MRIRKLSFALAAMALAVFGAQTQAQQAAESAEAAVSTGMACCDEAAKAGLVCLQCNPSSVAKVGEAAINFTLPDAEGKEHSLASFIDGENTVVLVWANPECPIYARHLREGTFNKLLEEFKDKPVKVVAIDSTDTVTPEKVKASVEEFDYKPVVLLDPSGKVGHAYEAKTTPHCYVITKEGKLVYSGAVDNNARGNETNPTNYVSLAVNAVLAGEEVETKTTQPYGCSIKYAPKSETTSAQDAADSNQG